MEEYIVYCVFTVSGTHYLGGGPTDPLVAGQSHNFCLHFARQISATKLRLLWTKICALVIKMDQPIYCHCDNYDGCNVRLSSITMFQCFKL